MDLAAELRRTREELADCEERLRSVLANSVDVVYRRDLRADRYDCVSPSVETLTGYTPEEFTRGGIDSTVGRIHPDDLEASRRAIERAMADPSGCGGAEYRYRRKDGAYRWFADHYTVIRDAAGAPRWWVGTVRDVTDMKASEAALRASHDELDAKVAERTAQLYELTTRLLGAEEAERERIGHVLHDDLQQVLVGLRYALHAFQRRSGGADIEVELVPLVERAIRLTRSLSGELLPPALAGERLAEGLSWVAGDMRERFGLDVRLALDPAADIRDPDMRMFVLRAVRELLFNVVKHGGVTEAELATGRVGAGRLSVEVSDRGVGYDVAAARARGTGLARIRDRLSFLDGDVRVESAPGRGTRVTLRVPNKGV